MPKFEDFLLPVLELISQHNSVEAARTTMLPWVSEKLQLSDEDCRQRLPSGSITTLRSRVGWALTYLKKAGLITSERRGQFVITPRGREFLCANAGGFGVKDLRQFPEFKAFHSVERENDDDTAHRSFAIDSQDPDDRIDNAIKEIRAAVAEDLLEILARTHPTAFEQIVLDLLEAMGYGGTSGHMEHTGGSGDFGIDGIVFMDRLGLEKVYIQAKRWKANVGSEIVQAFFGAIAGRRARKGIIITTSDFTPQAMQFAESVSDSLVLVNGDNLAQLMIDFGVGITKKKTIFIPSIDRDYFE
jgi:restriction system protein